MPPVRSAGVIHVQPGSAPMTKEGSEGSQAAQPKAKEAAKKGVSKNEPKQVRSQGELPQKNSGRVKEVAGAP